MTWFLPQLKATIESLLGDGFAVTTDIPANQTAWLAVPVFSVAKRFGRPLPDVAEEVAEKLRTIEGIDVGVAGGFVNVTPRTTKAVLADAEQDTYGSSNLGDGQKVLIELLGMNIAKPMGIGHLRSTIIGDALQRVYRALGYDVQSHNYLGDWGTQFGKLLVAYQKEYGDLVPRPELTIQDLLRLYVGFHEDAENDPELDAEAQEMFRRLETGDDVVRTLWAQMVEASVAEMNGILERLGGIHFDYPRDSESFYEPYLQEVIEAAKAKGLAEESDGALVVRVPGEETPLMLQKRNGTTTYATRDLAQVMYRVREFQPTKILYAVANEQALHFRQYHAVARLLGFAPDSVELVHVKFGLMRSLEGKFSTRAGRVIFLEDVLDEAVRRARAVVDEKNPDLPEAEKSRIAEVVGLGALKYFDLSHDRNKDIVFDWDRMLQLNGDSAPYLQYSYVRAVQILKKAGETGNELGEVKMDALPADVQALLRTLAKFPLVLEQVANQNAPHVLAQHLNHLASEFSRFYENYPVLTAEGEERAFRLAVVSGVANVLKRGLDLLGIAVVEQM